MTAAWMVEHPRLRRAWLMMLYTQALTLWALAASPRAFASTGAAMAAWTGLHDDDNVPLAKYFVSIVPIEEAIANTGVHLSATDPSSWVRWMSAATDAGLSHNMVAFAVTNEAAMLVFMLGVSLSVLKLALGSKWLVGLAKLGKPIFDAIQYLAWQIGLGPTAIAVCLGVAWWHHERGRTARAWSMAGTAFLFLILIALFFRNPVDDLISDQGMLGMMRRTGFAVAADIHMSVHSAAQSVDNQVDAMGSHLVTALARPSVQLINFNQAIDHIGNCRQKWSAAVLAADGSGAGPAHAMKTCGAPEALAHAQQLGANDIGFGLMANAANALISLFIWFVAISTFLVGTKALFFAVAVVPALLLGMIWQRAKFYGTSSAGQLALHGLQMLIFTVCLALGITGIEWVLTTDAFGPNPVMIVPRLILAGLGAIVGIVMFHWIDRSWHTHSLSTITHTLSGAWTSGHRSGRGDDYHDLTRYRPRSERVQDPEVTRPDSGRREQDRSDGQRPTAPAVPQVEVVKPRPTTLRHTKTSISPRLAKTAKTITKTGAAEVAGDVLAPEVVIPATAAAAVVHHVQHRSDTKRETGNRRTEASAEHAAIYKEVAAELSPPPEPHSARPAAVGASTQRNSGNRQRVDHKRLPPNPVPERRDATHTEPGKPTEISDHHRDRRTGPDHAPTHPTRPNRTTP